MAEAYMIDMIGAQGSRFPLGAIRAQSMSWSAMPHLAMGNGLVVRGEILPTPGAEMYRLARYSASDVPVELEIYAEDTDRWFRGSFHVAAFDARSHQAVFWSSGDLIASPA
ncbi:MAG: hypothetical protein EP335_14890 [Alphaproteobacteria bacterium]|nr:MAG: hypothetical protein EP335_14890 [Alphaproteobacteria bacterium]